MLLNDRGGIYRGKPKNMQEVPVALRPMSAYD
jgi:hypothetical protein